MEQFRFSIKKNFIVSRNTGKASQRKRQVEIETSTQCGQGVPGENEPEEHRRADVTLVVEKCQREVIFCH